MNRPSGSLNSRELGSAGESAAAAYLKHKGYRVIDFNFRTRYGEIDIICIDDKSLVFVEVKSTGGETAANLGERVHARKQKKLYLAALEYIQKHDRPSGDIRFDVLLLSTAPHGEWKIDHIVNAFSIDEFENDV